MTQNQAKRLKTYCYAICVAAHSIFESSAAFHSVTENWRPTYVWHAMSCHAMKSDYTWTLCLCFVWSEAILWHRRHHASSSARSLDINYTLEMKHFHVEEFHFERSQLHTPSGKRVKMRIWIAGKNTNESGWNGWAWRPSRFWQCHFIIDKI